MLKKFDRKQFTIYMVVAFVAAWILQLIASRYVNDETIPEALRSIIFSGILVVVMFTPMAGATVCGAGLKSIGWKIKLKGNMKSWLAAWFMPAVISIAGAVVFFVIFPDTLDLTGKSLMASVGEETAAILAGKGITPVMLIIISAIQAVSYAPLINMFAALGEEAGWRGVMYPMLKDKFGINKGRIIGGIIWGIWHWPVIILAGYEYGTDYYGAPFAGPVVFLIFTTCAGIILDHWYEKTKSIFTPSLGHGAINATASLAALTFDPDKTRMAILGPLPIGLVAGIPMIIYAAMICRNVSKKEE